MNEGNAKRRDSGRTHINILIGVCFVVCMIVIVSQMSVVYSKGGIYTSTEHGGTDVNSNGVTGASRPANTPGAGYTINQTDFPPGVCSNCHDEHSSYDSVTHTAEDFMLFDPGGANKNRYCYTCHTNALTTNVTYTTQHRKWMGLAKYDTSGHSISANMWWPGTTPAARTAADAGKCINCHEQHGTTFGLTGDVPAPGTQGQAPPYTSNDQVRQLTTRVEENLCFGCHKAGAPATTGDIQTLFSAGVNASPAFYTHPVNRNSAANDRTPSSHNILESLSPVVAQRHVECVDCHNPHYAGYNAAAGSNSHTLGTNVASPAIYGVWGVRTAGDPTLKASWPSGAALGTLNGAPAPFTPNFIDETGTDYEWELCIRCHSSYSAYPVFAAPDTLTDISREINPNNLSHHAIVRPGNNQLTSALAADRTKYDGTFTFATPRTKTVYCSDCHTTDMGSAITAVDGPHGSSRKFIIGSWCEARGGTDFGTAACANADQTAICFKCHKFGVYYNNASNAAYQSRSQNHNATHRVLNGSVYGSHLYCMVCHGGGTAGGIHGSNEGPGALGAGAEPRGTHFMNGACLESFDYKNAMGNMVCWTNTAATTYCLAGNSCIGQHAGKTDAVNYDYCEPVCPGT